MIKTYTMRINLISEREYQILLGIQKKYSALTYQQKGFDGPNRRTWNQKELKADKIVNRILEKSIIGFRYFQNFNVKDDKIIIRLQYNYNADGGGIPFTGVGYIMLDELKNGFSLKNTNG
jgi:hypothetical protein